MLLKTWFIIHPAVFVQNPFFYFIFNVNVNTNNILSWLFINHRAGMPNQAKSFTYFCNFMIQCAYTFPLIAEI